MGWENDQILPLTIWGRSKIRHKISTVACAENLSYIVTGSWDGNVFIWDLSNTDSNQATLRPRWIVTGQTTSVSALACFEKFFISCHLNGTIAHYEMPYGRLLKQTINDNYVHTNASAVSIGQLMCCGYYQDIVILDAYCLNITTILLSREQGDWISCFRYFTKDDGIHVQGLTNGGFLKTWSLNDAENGTCLENSLGPLGVRHSKAMSFHMTRRWLLLITTSQILVFDVGIHLIFKHTTTEALDGGDFYNDSIIFWTKNGEIFKTNVKTKIITKIFKFNATEFHVPGNRLLKYNNQTYLIGGDYKGILTILKITEENVEILTTSNVSELNTNGLFDGYASVTSSIHIATLNKFIAGCQDGKLLIYPATDLIISYFFNKPKPEMVYLVGHKAAIRCMLHPNSEQTRFADKILITGSDDFSVCIWDLFKSSLIHQFGVHSGPVIRLLTPPLNCGPANSICSVSADHSVAILNLRERRCAFLASQHPFPVVAIRWKPNHNVLLVKCFDGTVFVWELKTGVLDRIVCGLAAEEVVYDCDQPDEDALFDFYTNPSADELPRQPLNVTVSRESSPVTIYGFLTSLESEAFLLLINITQLSVHLKSIFPQNDPEIHHWMHCLALPEKNADNMKREKIERKLSTVSGTQLIPYAHLALSLIHKWGHNLEMDKLCKNSLGLAEPYFKPFFDHFSDQSFSLRHPSNNDHQRSLWDLIALNAITTVLGKYSFSPKTSQTDLIQWQNFAKYFNSQLNPNNNYENYEKLAQLWQTKSYAVRNSVRLILPECLLNATIDDKLMEKWAKFLPGRDNNQNTTAMAFVLCSLLTINGQAHNMCIGTSIKQLLTTRNVDSRLIATAIDFLGRGYCIWEKDMPLDEALVAVFERCIEYPEPDVVLTSRDALKTIAQTRLNQFIAHLKFLTKTSHPIFEPSKPEILALLRELLVDPPVGLISLLSDVVEVLLACIDPGRLKKTELPALLHIWLPQLHHHVTGQRVAVGMPDGKIVVHDLRARKAHVFPAHDGPIKAVRFSFDGKTLMALAVSGMGSLWQLNHGLFDIGVGQFRFRNLKTFATALPPLTSVKAVIINWRDSKTITIEAVNEKDNEPSTIVSINV